MIHTYIYIYDTYIYMIHIYIYDTYIYIYYHIIHIPGIPFFPIGSRGTVVIHPTVASIATRPCFSSASRSQRMSMANEKPIGSKPPGETGEIHGESHGK